MNRPVLYFFSGSTEMQKSKLAVCMLLVQDFVSSLLRRFLSAYFYKINFKKKKRKMKSQTEKKNFSETFSNNHVYVTLSRGRMYHPSVSSRQIMISLETAPTFHQSKVKIKKRGLFENEEVKC